MPGMTNLEVARRQRRWTQTQLAEEAGLPPVSGQKFVSLVENGYRPRYTTEHNRIARLAEALELPHGSLLALSSRPRVRSADPAAEVAVA
jgi:transcriptional regulator with XRE-family HTH domain